jgi:glutamyl-tRNA synthetase
MDNDRITKLIPFFMIRVRFAPSPTGFMHLGNVRAALLNYLIARQRKGSFILRIEDTDQQRLVDVGAQQIFKDLEWLGLAYTEGPYFQSERNALYEEYRVQFEAQDRLYRCFCTAEELEKKRERQIMLKKPPRYDRACAALTREEIAEKCAAKKPFIWRFKLSNDEETITDIARGTINFALSNFSDPTITRQDGSFTFLFANFVDDVDLGITHVIRGEDHLSNTAVQSALYRAYGAPLPTFWHLPIMCNAEGQKLSKRDFGFSLSDLRAAGYLPEAIINYLATIGGSFAEEILSIEDLVAQVDLQAIASAGTIRYDPAKLAWLNKKWIERLAPADLATRADQSLLTTFPQAGSYPTAFRHAAIARFRGEYTTLADIPRVLAFIWQRPVPETTWHNKQLYQAIDATAQEHFSSGRDLYQALAAISKSTAVPSKEFFGSLRMALIGAPTGPALIDIIETLGVEESQRRLRGENYSDAS